MRLVASKGKNGEIVVKVDGYWGHGDIQQLKQVIPSAVGKANIKFWENQKNEKKSD